MLLRASGIALVVTLTCAFQPATLRWRSPVVIILRFAPEGMPLGMYASAVAAAGLWRGPSVEIRIVEESHAGEVNGVIRYGGALALGHGIMGTILRMGVESGELKGCDVQVADTVVPWHTGVEPPGPEEADALTAFAHEFGHCLGLLHENGATPPALMRTAIHYGEYHRTLPPDDTAARDRLFPAARRRSGCGLRF